MQMNWKAAGMAGLAWMTLGFGILALHFGFLPSGIELVAQGVGLFLAGAISAALLTATLAGQRTPLGRFCVQVGYLFFAPLGLMMALLAPVQIETGVGAVPWSSALLAALAITLLASLAVAIGLGFTGSMAMAAHAVAVRVQRRQAVA
jgi:hypothetical protein